MQVLSTIISSALIVGYSFATSRNCCMCETQRLSCNS